MVLFVAFLLPSFHVTKYGFLEIVFLFSFLSVRYLYVCHKFVFRNEIRLYAVVSLIVFGSAISGSPVLGYLAAGILIGPYGLSIIRHVHGTKAIAEFGVVFLLFNIGLEVDSV